jgi:C4-dicarboxylate-specific signal transduction histidine kinase
MKRPGSTSLRRSLVIPGVAIMVITCLGLVAVGYWAGHSIVTAMSEELIRHMSISIRDHMRIMIDRPVRLLARTEESVARHHIPLDSPKAVAKELYALLDENSAADWLYFANEAGGIISVGRLADGRRVFLMTDGFRAGTIREYDASADGEIGGERKSDGYFDARQKEWYSSAKLLGKSYWTKPYIGAVEPILGVSLSAPAIGRRGELLGVYGLDLTMTRLSNFLKQQRLGKTGRSFVVDTDGYLIASSGAALPVVADAQGREQRVAARNAPDTVVRATATYLAGHPEKIAISRKGEVHPFVFDDPDLGRISAAVQSIPGSDGGYWMIVSALPVADFLGIARQAGVLSLGLMAILVSGALVGGFLWVSRVLRPLETLTAAAHVIADGGWPDVPETARGDEIGVLARALDNMIRNLRTTHAELERRVSARTAELSDTVASLKSEIDERIRIGQALEAETAARIDAQSELHEKEVLLLQQSRLAALGEMIGNIAHQWRQPLNLLGLLIQELPITYMKGDFSREYLEEAVKKMLATIRHMSRTIDDFRNFSTPDKERVDFRVLEVIEKTLSLLDGSLRANGITAAVVTTADPAVNGYPNEFAQALLNIVINARDALVARGRSMPSISVTVGAEKGRCQVTVADNAGGVPESILDKIFDPYFTTKGPDKGTGIGLYMAKTIIEKHMGGTLSVRNSSEGAEFLIELPKA